MLTGATPSLLVGLEGALEALDALELPAIAASSSASPSSPPAGGASRLRSPLPDVSGEAWEAFLWAIGTQPIGYESPTGALGMFALHPRRLEELGFMRNVRFELGRCVGDFVPPWSRAELLAKWILQVRVVVRSSRLYDEELAGGRIRRPREMSRSGALALVHVAGRRAPINFAARPFASTQLVYDRARDLF